jgi:hypothetical protein
MFVAVGSRLGRLGRRLAQVIEDMALTDGPGRSWSPRNRLGAGNVMPLESSQQPVGSIISLGATALGGTHGDMCRAAP